MYQYVNRFGWPYQGNLALVSCLAISNPWSISILNIGTFFVDTVQFLSFCSISVFDFLLS